MCLRNEEGLEEGSSKKKINVSAFSSFLHFSAGYIEDLHDI